MPTYDYQCQNCGHVYETFATFKQKEAGFKPECLDLLARQCRECQRLDHPHHVTFVCEQP